MNTEPPLAEYEPAALLIIEHCQPMTLHAMAAQLGLELHATFDLLRAMEMRGEITCGMDYKLRLPEEHDQ